MKVEAAGLEHQSYSGQTSSKGVQTQQVKQMSETELPSGKELMEKRKNQPYSMSVSEKTLIEMIERANKAIEGVYTTFEYSIHEQTHEIIVKVLNKETNEVIREIPSEKILDMVAKIWEMTGIIVDERR